MGIAWLRLSSLRVLGWTPASSPWPTPDGFISGEFSDGTTSSGIGGGFRFSTWFSFTWA
ncbi:hypothetical protein PR003_g23338 [Phytophthora rubi]|uniref:RNase H type-1 domain-containing protein n=1 Tax=Phytophthora rubi TaxID=129364 RepID=A0A6A3GXP3_9STRA|nr:hypothetical protein PR001_g29909 [Phytophthora rubi]KAE8964569.1 hypothetical protein PR002_g28936 [Phytophthora rubi]KAE9298070.1 hypothetical protein PR003_g23338 [Phytophthora rubi]